MISYLVIIVSLDRFFKVNYNVKDNNIKEDKEPKSKWTSFEYVNKKYNATDPYNEEEWDN